MSLARTLAKTYDPKTVEPRLSERWQRDGVYQFDRASDRPVYAIDTPPATVSGHLHLGHVYSYSHTDFIARFWRMNGHNVFYPMGFDDNGLPTERLVEKRLGVTAAQVGRAARSSSTAWRSASEAEEEYRALWQRLGLSIDWRFSYRSIDDARAPHLAAVLPRPLSQGAGLPAGGADASGVPSARRPSPRPSWTTWSARRPSTRSPSRWPTARRCPSPRRARSCCPPVSPSSCIPTMRAMPALIGSERARCRCWGARCRCWPIRWPSPEKGTGAVMCCTFGDATDVEWWRAHELPLRVDHRARWPADDGCGRPMRG